MNTFKLLRLIANAGLLFAATSMAHAQGNNPPMDVVSIKDAWVRATNPGQSVGAAYMTLTSSKDATLTKVESDVTPSVEIHSMSMQNGVMKMRMLEKLPLTAHKPYPLAPGGYHIMLFDLKKPLTPGEQVNFVLHFRDGKNAPFQQNVKVNVKAAEEAGEHQHH